MKLTREFCRLTNSECRRFESVFTSLRDVAGFAILPGQSASLTRTCMWIQCSKKILRMRSRSLSRSLIV